jgi:hypothetical protein
MVVINGTTARDNNEKTRATKEDTKTRHREETDEKYIPSLSSMANAGPKGTVDVLCNPGRPPRI